MNWKPRCSSLGGYVCCDYRAMFDRAMSEGIFPAQPEETKPYADLGTLIHYALMKGMKLKFPDGERPPTQAMVTSAAALFTGDEMALQERVKECVATAIPYVPKPPEGTEWLCETNYKTPNLTGSIDFISSDGSVIGDLKTTSRKPSRGKVKPAHLYQLLGYKMLAETRKAKPKSAWVLYLGSLTDWALLVPFSLETKPIDNMCRYLERYVTFLRSKNLYQFAMPRIGPTCEDDFCPHRAQCRDLVLPAAGESGGEDMPAVKANPFGDTNVPPVTLPSGEIPRQGGSGG